MGERHTTQAQAKQRRVELLAAIRESGSLSVAELLQRFSVSGETLRRDLRLLEEQRAIVRSYGEVQAIASGAFETALEFRSQNRTDEKARIARAGASLLGDARTVFVDEGFLSSLLASELPDDNELTIITSSIPAALQVVNRPQTEVILLGGRLRPNTLGLVEQWAVSMLEGLQIDVAFLGANGVGSDGALTTPDPTVAAVKAAAIRSSTRRILVAAHYKFGLSTFIRFGHLTDFEAMITGRELSPNIARSFAHLTPELVRV